MMQLRFDITASAGCDLSSDFENKRFKLTVFVEALFEGNVSGRCPICYGAWYCTYITLDLDCTGL